MTTARTIYIVGPTASGKSDLALEIAKAVDGEIVCADSQTLRRHMNIGTAKPSMRDQKMIPHHLLDIIDPYEQFSLAQYIELAHNAISDIRSRHKTPIIVGGTGLYVDALYFNFSLPDLDDEAYMQRSQLNDLSLEKLTELIHEKNIPLPQNHKNKRHLINTLLRNGRSGTKRSPDTGAVIVGISPGRDVLNERISRRIEKMFEGGFVEEIKNIVVMYGRPPIQFDAIGYRIGLRYIDGEITLDEAKEMFRVADRQYARRQLQWLRRNKDIKWFSNPVDAENYILSICKK